ncbi:hypothetical protein BDN72DRAFT_772960 [Pluteus cervinus]|uniref:Uncharacterized protein n=1 Tax=Pluteus cervinus TaxID=181527 RepID=A0ACD3AKE7_9AGAR|nr:hypothetical protein BDN72DRAFT_772960 [Pluteus cervinus]
MTSPVLGDGHNHRHPKRHPSQVNATAPELVVRHERGLAKRFDNARLSFFDPGASACGGFNTDADFIVALNIPQFDGDPGHHCFEGITITYGGKTTQATITDRCGDCPYGGIDLSRGLFDFFASEDAGIIYGTWNFGSGAPPPPSPSPPPPPPTSSSPPPTPSSSTPPSSTIAHTSTSSNASASTTSSGGSANPSATATVDTPNGIIAQFYLAFLELGGIVEAGGTWSG